MFWLARRIGILCVLALVGCDREGLPDRDGSVEEEDSGNGPTDRGMVVNVTVTASRVIDGDTIILAAGASLRAPDGAPLQGETVRLIGINAPEIAHGDGGPAAECWSEESKDALAELVAGRVVELEYGRGDLRDIYGRLLAYVSLPSTGEVVNETMVSEGHARSFRDFPHEYTALYNRLESEAEVARRGLWGAAPPCN
jgi:micrococcal nuclease